MTRPLPAGQALANLLGGQRSRRKSSTGGRATKRLSERTDFNSANTSTVVVLAPGLSRGNRPGDTERESSIGNQQLPAHSSLHRLNGAAILPCTRVQQLIENQSLTAMVMGPFSSKTVPQTVPWSSWISAKCWSEWQDLNLRPPRPERGALPTVAQASRASLPDLTSSPHARPICSRFLFSP